MTMAERRSWLNNESLADLLDRLVETGVVAAGDLLLGLADVDLIRVNLRLVLASVDALSRQDDIAEETVRTVATTTVSPMSRPRRDRQLSAVGPTPDRASFPGSAPEEFARPGWDGTAADREDFGLGSLILAVIEIIRQLLERQALHRMQAGSLTDDQVERLGLALMQLEQRVNQLAEVFGQKSNQLESSAQFPASFAMGGNRI